MKAGGLIDTGAILALLDRDDAWHTACVETFGGLRLPLLTSEAVLAELFHLVGEKRHEVNAAWEFLRCGAVLLAELSDQELPAIRALMAKYHDQPMDVADATLVYLAGRESLNTVFTVDRTDFETYRISNRRRFRVLPERAAW
jgi:predicted nucleic acid-binding protein